HGVAVERGSDPRCEREDRDDRGKGELEARVEQRVRVPREQDDRAEEQEVPPVLLARRDPGERAERTRDRGPDDRRLRAYSEDVGTDRGECAELADEAVVPAETRQEQR